MKSVVCIFIVLLCTLCRGEYDRYFGLHQREEVDPSGALSILDTLIRPEFELFRDLTTPTQEPSAEPTAEPSSIPTTLSTIAPSLLTAEPSVEPSAEPTASPTATPTDMTTFAPTLEPSVAPGLPTFDPTPAPTSQPSSQPSSAPSGEPTAQPSSGPTSQPVADPTSVPSARPIHAPTPAPTVPLTQGPSVELTAAPTLVPSQQQSDLPSPEPSSQPSSQPSVVPTGDPTSQPSSRPSTRPSAQPSSQPSNRPSPSPTIRPTPPPGSPTVTPTALPTYVTTAPIISTPIVHNTTRSTITLFVNFTQPAFYSGTVYCAAFTNTSAVVRSNDVIIATGVSTAYAAGHHSAKVVVTGVSPLTSYAVYCTVRTFDGTTSLLADTRSTKQVIQTACCKSVAFTNNPRYVYGTLSKYTTAQSKQYVFSYKLSALPAANVVITPTVRDASGTVVPSNVLAVLPVSHHFRANSTSLEGSFVLSANSTELSGVYTVSLARRGASAAQYTNTTTTVTVLAASALPPPPVLLSAKFGSSGGTFDVTFDSNTNKAGLSTSFACTQVLSFAGANVSSCVWSSSSVVRVTFAATTTTLVAVDGPVTLFGDVLRAACVQNCSTYNTSDAQTVLMQAPDAPIVPVVVIQVPSMVSNCDNLTIDATLTSGNGGRAWSSVVWSVTKQTSSDSTTDAAILSILQSQGASTVSTVTISKTTLSLALYTLTLTVTNFFGEVGTASAMFTISDNPNVPILTIPGPSVVNVIPSDSLVLYTLTTLSSCAEAGVVVSYSWSVEQDGVVQSSIVSTSADSSKFRLSPYTLTGQTVYTVQLTATAAATPSNPAVSSTATFTVVVGPGAVISVVLGGNYRYLASQDPFTLDASDSYDQGAPSSVLTYTWACSILSVAQFGESCEDKMPTDRTTAVLRVGAAPLVVGTVYQFTVTATASDGRSSSFPVAVQNTAGATITSINNVNLIKVDPHTRLALSGFVTGGYALDASWVASIDGEAQSFVANSPLSKTFTASEVANTLAYSLSVPVNTFTPGSVVTFRLQAHQSGTANTFSSYSDVTIAMNAPPSSGVLSVAPTTGVALSTVFTLLTTSWTDDPADLPLSYEYTYALLASAPRLTIQSRTSSNKVSSVLPAGLTSQNQLVSVICAVYDTFMAASSVSVQVEVTANSRVDVSLYIDDGLTAAAATGSTNAVSQVIANGASSINTVNCGSAPPSMCAAFNRSACYATPQTCSVCLDGYTGIVGDYNAPCRNTSVPSTLGGVGAVCAADADCELYSCVDSVCAVPVLQCQSETTSPCSGHGRCAYLDGTGKNFSTTNTACTLYDVSCFATCQCDAGFGGQSCSLAQSDLDSRDTTRAKLCGAILSVSAGSDASYLMLDSLVSGLYASYNSYEVVQSASSDVCWNALTTLSNYAAQGYLSEAATSLILQTTSKYLQSSATSSARRLSSLSSRALSTSGDALDTSASEIITGMLNNLVGMQDAAAYADEQMQILVVKSLSGDTTSLAPPLSPEAAAYTTGLTASIELAAGTAALVRDTGGFVQMAILQWGSNPYAGSQDLVSPLLRMEIAELNVTDQEVLALNATLAGDPAFYVTLQFAAVQDFNFSLTIEEAMITGAPNFTVPSCSARTADGYAHSPCAISTYSNYNVTFACQLEALFPAAAGRRLQFGGSKTIQFGSILADLDNELATYLSKNPFKVDYEKARIVIIFLAVLSLVIILGYIIFRYWDIQDRKFLVEKKAARDQMLFNQRHAELLAVRKLDRTRSIKPMEWHRDPPNQLADAMSTAFKTHWASSEKKRNSLGDSGFVDIYTAQSGFFVDMFDQESPHNSSSLMITPNNGRPVLKNPRSFFSKSDSLSSVQFDSAHSHVNDPNWEREFFVSNTVANYLASVMPKGSLGDSPGFWYTIVRYHKYTAAFVGRSLQHTRVLRWTNACIGLLVTLFINTLLYGIFYPDDGECEDKITRDECLDKMSSVYDARFCRWTADDAVIAGGNCTLNPPPDHFVFIIVIVVITVLISLPVQFAYEYLLYTICMRRPRLETCGLSTERWLGESTQKGELEESVQSPLKGLHDEAAAKHWITQHQDFRTDLRRGASQVFHESQHPRHEADALLLAVNQALEARIYGQSLPWKSVGQTARSRNLRAIQTRLGIYANGTPVALTGIQWLRFGTRKEQLICEIKAARVLAKQIEEHVDSLDRTDIRGREKMLFQYFILEQFSSFKKFLLKRFLFDFADTTPHMINPFLWCVTWAFVILSMAFFLYWGFIWGASQGGSTAGHWGINLGSAIAQDMLIIQMFRVYFIYSLSMLSLKPQLRSIYRVLHRVCVDYAQDQLEADGLDIAVVQHLSPACRASHSDVCAQLSAARVLRHVCDSDVEQCKQSFNARMAVAASVVLTIPLLIAIISEVAGTSFLESLLPAFLDALLVSNYYFYTAAGLFILIPYIVIFAMFAWYYLFKQVRAASYRHNAFFFSSLETDSDSGDVTQNWNASERTTTAAPSAFAGIWKTNKQIQSWWSGESDLFLHKCDLQWEMMNRPSTLQAVESMVSPMVRKTHHRKSVSEKNAAAEKAKAGMNVPSEVLDMTVGGSGDWLVVWAGANNNSPRENEGGGYLVELMNRASSQSQLDMDEEQEPVGLETSFAGGSDDGSFTGFSYRPSLQPPARSDHQTLSTADEEALESILTNYRACVNIDRMRLVDEDETDELRTGTATTCDVLIEFSDLRILLEEHLAQQRPNGRVMSADDKIRIVDACYNWVSGLGDEMLEQHYNHDTAKIAAATLVRTQSSFSPPISPFGSPSRSTSSRSFAFGGSFKSSRRERINFSVPFQEFRRWAQHSGGMLQGFNPQASNNVSSRRSSRTLDSSIRFYDFDS